MQTFIDRSTFRTRALAIAFIALVLVILAWNVPAFAPILYPFRLFVTFVHEAGHGLAAKLSGGNVLGFVVYSNGAGVATTAGGSRALILMSGYVGAALFGALLFYAANMWHRTRHIAVVVGAGLVVFSLMYARPDDTGSPTALLVGIGFGAALLVAAWKLPVSFVLLSLNILAMLTGLNAVLDLKGVFENSGSSLGQVRNDAAAFSAEVLPLPPAIVALAWAFIAIGFLGLSVYLSVYKPLRRGSASPASPETPQPEKKRPQDESIMDILKRDR
jgi:hypothetical protein